MTDAIISEVQGHAGIITVNRPQALNALNQDMIEGMTRVLKKWRDDDSVALVIVRGAGERGLCAGGDIATLYEDAKEGGTAGAQFWRDEYELNHLISVYPKPYVALMTGIVLGGGIGISAHGSHRIVTDDSRIGMPEVGIGYSPDAGGSHILSRSADRLGRHLAYTAGHVGAAEAIDAGFADYYVPQARLEELVTSLADSGSVDVITDCALPLGPGFGDDRAEMVEVYSADTVAETLARLDALAAKKGDEHWAAKAATRIRRNSPLGVRVTEEALRRAESLDLAQTLIQEFWMSLNMQRHPEFVEGIRAQIIDKDRNPTWEYASVEEVPDSVVADVFEPLPGYTPPQVG